MFKINKTQKREAFHSLIRSGGLASYRELCHEIVETNILRLRNKRKDDGRNSDDDLYVSATLRYSSIFEYQFNLNSLLKLSTGKLAVYAMPFSWCRALGQPKPIALVSAACFFIYLVCRASYRFLRTIAHSLESFSNSKEVSELQNKNYLFFAQKENFNPRGEQPNQYVLETWLYNHLIKNGSGLVHSNLSLVGFIDRKHTYVRSFFPKMVMFNYLKFLFISAYSFFESLALLLVGKWQKLFLIDEIVYSIAFSLAKTQSICGAYLIPFQGSQARPLWSRVAELRGSKVYQLNYASYMLPELRQPFKDRLHLHASEWSYVLPLNEVSASYLESKLPKKTSILKGPTLVFGDDSAICIPKFERPMVSVFDIAILDVSKFIGMNPINDFLAPRDGDYLNFHRSFFAHVLSLAIEFDLCVALKQKRIDDRLDKNYIELVREFSGKKHFNVIDPRVSANRLVDESKMSIVQPFSSVGIYDAGKNNICFYDPTMQLWKSHELALGTDICVGFSDLKRWLQSKLV